MTGYPEELVKHYHLQYLGRFLVYSGKKMLRIIPPTSREFEAMVTGSTCRDRLVAATPCST